jgi:hypothetical protein
MPLPGHGGVSPTERDVDLPGVRDAAHERGAAEAEGVIVDRPMWVQVYSRWYWIDPEPFRKAYGLT